MPRKVIPSKPTPRSPPNVYLLIYQASPETLTQLGHPEAKYLSLKVDGWYNTTTEWDRRSLILVEDNPDYEAVKEVLRNQGFTKINRFYLPFKRELPLDILQTASSYLPLDDVLRMRSVSKGFLPTDYKYWEQQARQVLGETKELKDFPLSSDQFTPEERFVEYLALRKYPGAVAGLVKRPGYFRRLGRERSLEEINALLSQIDSIDAYDEILIGAGERNRLDIIQALDITPAALVGLARGRYYASMENLYDSMEDHEKKETRQKLLQEAAIRNDRELFQWLTEHGLTREEFVDNWTPFLGTEYLQIRPDEFIPLVEELTGERKIEDVISWLETLSLTPEQSRGIVGVIPHPSIIKFLPQLKPSERKILGKKAVFAVFQPSRINPTFRIEYLQGLEKKGVVFPPQHVSEKDLRLPSSLFFWKLDRDPKASSTIADIILSGEFSPEDIFPMLDRLTPEQLRRLNEKIYRTDLSGRTYHNRENVNMAHIEIERRLSS